MTLAGYWKSERFFFAFGDLMGSVKLAELPDSTPPLYPFSLENSDVILPSGRAVPWGMKVGEQYVLAGWMQKVIIINNFICMTWAGAESDAKDLIQIIRDRYGNARPTRKQMYEEIELFKSIKNRDLQFSLSLIEEDRIHSAVFRYKVRNWQGRQFVVGGTGADDFLDVLLEQKLNQFAIEDFQEEDMSQKISEMMLIGSVLLAEEHTRPSAYQLGYGSGYEAASIFPDGDGGEAFYKLNGVTTLIFRPMARNGAIVGWDRHFQIIKTVYKNKVTSVCLVDFYLPFSFVDKTSAKCEIRIFNVPEPGQDLSSYKADVAHFAGDVGFCSIILLGTQVNPGAYKIYTKTYVDKIKFGYRGDEMHVEYDSEFSKRLKELCDDAYAEWTGRS